MPVRPRLPGFRRSMPHADRGLALSRLQRGPRLNPPRRSLVRCPATQCVRGHACAPASSFATLSGSLVTGLSNSQYSLAPVLASNRRRREASRSRTWGGRSVVSRCSSKAGTASPNTLDSKRAPTLNQLNSRGRPGRAGSMASASTRSRAGEEGVSCRIIRPGTCRTSDAIDPATPGPAIHLLFKAKLSRLFALTSGRLSATPNRLEHQHQLRHQLRHQARNPFSPARPFGSAQRTHFSKSPTKTIRTSSTNSINPAIISLTISIPAGGRAAIATTVALTGSESISLARDHIGRLDLPPNHRHTGPFARSHTPVWNT